MEFNELVETITAEEASLAKLFGGDGIGVQSRTRDAIYLGKLAEAAKLVARVAAGDRRAALLFNEAMTTSDFPVLFGDILNRQIVANYQEAPYSWNQFVRRSLVNDFRTVKRMRLEGGEGVLKEVLQQGEYEERALTDGNYGYAVKKYGARLPLSWETIVNDDLDTFRDIPQRFGRAARRSEEKFATQLFVGANGPLGTFFTSGVNQLTGNPALSIAALQAAMTLLSKMKDSDGEPIMVEAMTLVVPPALEIIANNIANATQIELTSDGGNSTQRLIAPNWMRNRLKIVVNYYLPIVSTTANGDTSWYLFASPSNGRPALEMGFLKGHEQPEMFMKAPNATRIGGSGAVSEDFLNDSINYKVRHVFGGGTQDTKMAVGSNGSGA